MPNVPVENHSLEGCRFVYRGWETPYDPFTDDEPGTLILGNAMAVEVRKVFHNWNDVPGLTILYVHVPATGYHTHVTPKDLGITSEV